MEKISGKVDIILEKINEINVTLAQQHESLKYHIKRTDLIEEDIKPIKAHVAAVKMVMQLVGVAAALGATTEGVVSLLEYLKK